MQMVADCLKVLVGAEAHIDLFVIPGVIAVRIGFKDRGKIDRVRAKFLDMGIQSSTFAIRFFGTPSFSNGAPQKPSG